MVHQAIHLRRYFMIAFLQHKRPGVID